MRVNESNRDGEFALNRVQQTADADSGQSSEAPAVEETRVSAAEQVKSFVSGGFGGVSAVLVGACIQATQPMNMEVEACVQAIRSILQRPDCKPLALEYIKVLLT